MPEVDYVVITAGGFDILLEVVCEDDDHLLDVVNRQSGPCPGVRHTETFVYLQAPQADLHLGNPMTDHSSIDARRPTTRRCPTRTRPPVDALHPACPPTRTAPGADHRARGRARTSSTTRGKRYLDGLAGLFVVQVGHGRTELAEAAAKQASELAFFPLWSYAHPQGDRARRAARRPTPRATSTGSSSPPAAVRRSRARGSWPSSTSSSPASR